MAITRFPSIGVISEGTLRPEDLIPTFLDELERYAPEAAAQIEYAHADALALLDNPDDDDDAEALGWLLDALEFALMDIAPPYTYFGTLEGDGACFGFWPAIDALARDADYEDGVLKVDAGDRYPTDVCCIPRQSGGSNHGTGCPLADIRYIMSVTDHGNVTLIDIAHVPPNFDGDVIWSAV